VMEQAGGQTLENVQDLSREEERLTPAEESQQARDKMGDLAEMISDPILEEAARKGDYSVLGLLRRKLPPQLQTIAVSLYKEELGLKIDDDESCLRALAKLEEVAGSNASISAVRRVAETPEDGVISYNIIEVAQLYRLALEHPLYEETIKDIIAYVGEVAEDRELEAFAEKINSQESV